MATAELSWSGRSRAVLLPEGLRIEDSEVRIRRRGAAVILEPMTHDRAWLDALAGPLDADLQQAATAQPVAEDRADAPASRP